MEDCDDCDLGLFNFYHKYSNRVKDLFYVCVRHKLLLENKDCESCGKPAVLDFNRKLWRCQKISGGPRKKKRRCNWNQSVFKNTFFEIVQTSDIETLLIFVNIFVRSFFSYGFVRNELGLSNSSICEWTGVCQEVLIEWCLKQEGKIGGKDKVVQVVESKFGNRKYNHGQIVEGQLVFGGVCRATQSCFMVPVEGDRDSTTFREIIEERIEPGTIVFSDYWKARECLSESDFQHLTLDLSLTFVDPSTDRNSNAEESLRRKVKSRLPLLRRRREHFVGNLARSMFMIGNKDPNKRLHVFLQEVASLYSPFQPSP